MKEQRKAIVAQILTNEARVRLANIAVVKNARQLAQQAMAIGKR